MKRITLRLDEDLYNKIKESSENVTNFIRDAVLEKLDSQYGKSPSFKKQVKQILSEIDRVKEMQLELNINSENYKDEIREMIKKSLEIIPNMNKVISNINDKLK